jgi:hypothetical protein
VLRILLACHLPVPCHSPLLLLLLLVVVVLALQSRQPSQTVLLPPY